MKKIIHINQHVIKSNRKHGKTDPAITVKTYKENHYSHTVQIHGPSTVVYNPSKPLSCGAHCWVETNGSVQVNGKEL